MCELISAFATQSFAVCESQFLLDYYTQIEKNYTCY